MPLPEFEAWKAYYRVEPWGAEADDARLRYLCSVVANAAGAKTTPDDFGIRWGAERVRLSFRDGILELAARVGSTVKDDG